MENQAKDEKEKILTVNGKSFTPEVEENRKQQLLKARAELEAQFKSGKIDSVEYNRRIVDLEIPEEYKNQQRTPRKKRRRLLILLTIILLLCAIPAVAYVCFRYYFQNTLQAENIELILPEKPDDAEDVAQSEDGKNDETLDGPVETDETKENNKPEQSTLETGPIQIEVAEKSESGEYKNRQINIIYKDYYDITGIVTSVHDFWGFDDYATLVPRDVCLAWGSLAEIFLQEGVHFKQYYRNCYGKASSESGETAETFTFKTPFGQVRSSLALMSNNHLIASTAEIRNQIFSLKNKDEVRIKGYLVNVKYGEISLNSSTGREDVGNDACEVIYVTEIENHGQKNKN